MGKIGVLKINQSKYKKNKKILLFSLILIPFLSIFSLIISSNNLIVDFKQTESIDLVNRYSLYDNNDLNELRNIDFLQNRNIKFPSLTQNDYIKWKESVINLDQNENGINDQFEQKLDTLLKSSIPNESRNEEKLILSKKDIIDVFFGKNTRELENISYNHIPVIIHFPNGNINSFFSIFENLGGEIKSKFNISINGFAGNIDYEGLNLFCDILRNQNIPFFVEEDSIVQTNLYYNSLNLRLRPYVWNTLNYTGDENSSIAIIDTGIDDSHNFFNPGYSSEDFNYKIVGWKDVLNDNSSPYDDEGHGSHCAGIATGQGFPVYDDYGRVVSTYSLGFDYTGNRVGNQTIDTTAAIFNVTEPGKVEIQCEFNDLTQSSDNVYILAYLYYNESIVDSYVSYTPAWNFKLLYFVSNNTIGVYSFRLKLVFKGVTSYVHDPHIRFRGEIHWPFNISLMDSGDAWKGVAPDTHLVGVKVLDSSGVGYVSDVIKGINWAITNKLLYHITTISMSLGSYYSIPSLVNVVNNAVENGIITVVSAGNYGAQVFGGIGSPGNADNVITVAAMSHTDHLTEYSSSGRPSSTQKTTKPDIMAPGGSKYTFKIFSTDTNDNDAAGEFFEDSFPNDMYPAMGTSMSAPNVAGAANLLIEAMGGYQNWGYTAIEAKRIKALLLMTATETYPLKREALKEIFTFWHPELNRGGKDLNEGYGRINIDTALEACTQEFLIGQFKGSWLSSSLISPNSKHALGCYVDLVSGVKYHFQLSVPENVDFDLYLYSNTPTSIGEPTMVSSSISSELGTNENFDFIPKVSGRYYLIVKAISGEGYAEITYNIIENPPKIIYGPVSPETGVHLIILLMSVFLGVVFGIVYYKKYLNEHFTFRKTKDIGKGALANEFKILDNIYSKFRRKFEYKKIIDANIKRRSDKFIASNNIFKNLENTYAKFKPKIKNKQFGVAKKFKGKYNKFEVPSNDIFKNLENIYAKFIIKIEYKKIRNN